jgi:AcrR family transcriptional regulator
MPSSRQRAVHLGPGRRRPMVLDAALGLVTTHGYSGTSMEMIAKAAGVSRPVVYDCYPSKAALFRALLTREEQRLLEQLVAALPAEPRLDDVEGLLSEGFTRFLEAVSTSPDSWRVVFLADVGSEREVARRVVRARGLITERLAEVTQFVLESRGVADAPRLSWLGAYQMVGMAEAAVRLLLERPGEWSPHELGAQLGRMAAAGDRVLGGEA